MEVAAGITGFVCAVGQACQFAAQLHAFFTNITNAPTQIQQLSEKLIGLHSVLARINDVAISLDADSGVEISADVKMALMRTLRKLEVVQGVVRKLDVNIVRDGTGDKWKLKRNWMKVKWAFKEDEIWRLCGDLDSEKAGLGLALQSLSLSLDAISLRNMEGLQASMEGLIDTSRQHTEIVKSHVDDRFVSLQRSLNTISGHIERANTLNMLPDEIMALIQTTVTQSVQEAMTKALFTGTTPTFGNTFSDEPVNLSRATTYGGEEMKRGYSGSTLADSIQEEDILMDWNGWPEDMDDIQTVSNNFPVENYTSIVPAYRGCSSTTVGHRYRHYKRVPTSLGLLLMFYTTAASTSSSSNWGDTSNHLSSAFEMGFTFIPAAWLFTTALTASFTKTTHFAPSPINDMNINFKTFHVVSTTADVMLYARLGDTLKLKELFSKRAASPMDRDRHGRTPLHWAAAMGHVDSCALLLQNGADPTVPNEMARTPLHWTTFLSCNTDVVQLLISHGCDPDIPNVGGQSSLFSTGGKNYAAVLEAMLGQDHFMVDIDQADNWGRTPLMWVVGSEKEEDLKSISALLKRGASVTKTDKQGLTPLHLLMLSATPRLNKKESMVSLLRAGADPRAISSTELGGLTPTDIAKHNEVLNVWAEALSDCRLDPQNVMRKGSRENEEAIVATAIGRVQRSFIEANENGLKRRKRIEETDYDEIELDTIKRSKIEEIPRRVQYQLFEGDLEQPEQADLLGYQAQLMALQKQNIMRVYSAKAEQEELTGVPSIPPKPYPNQDDVGSGHPRGAESRPTDTYSTRVDHNEHTPLPAFPTINITESNPSPSYTFTPVETTPTPAYGSRMEMPHTERYSSQTTKRCDDPLDYRDIDLSYSEAQAPLMNSPSSCRTGYEFSGPIRNSKDIQIENIRNAAVMQQQEARQKYSSRFNLAYRRFSELDQQLAMRHPTAQTTANEEQLEEARRQLRLARNNDANLASKKMRAKQLQIALQQAQQQAQQAQQLQHAQQTIQREAEKQTMQRMHQTAPNAAYIQQVDEARRQLYRARNIDASLACQKRKALQTVNQEIGMGGRTRH